MSLKDYNSTGLAKVLDGAADLTARAARIFHGLSVTTPPVVRTALVREAEVCLQEAEALINKVRSEGRP